MTTRTTMIDRRQHNGSKTGKPVLVPSGYDWSAFLRRHGRRITFTIDGCWLWTGASFRGGYGAVKIPGGEVVRVHRLAWTLLVGPLTPGLTLDHLCRRTSCLNPEHMEEIDAGENRRRAPISGWAKVHAAKTHCAQGHPFDGEAGKQRICSTCRRKAGREYAARQRAARKGAVA